MNTARNLIVPIIAIAAAAGGFIALAETTTTAPRPAGDRSLASDKPLVKRGEYIVHGVGLCVDCHSPRGERGEFVAGRHLTGSPIPFAPTIPMPAWATTAPSIAGLPPGWDEEAMVRFLMTGERPNNMPSTRPPMPPYRMSRDDAEAVAAYVHSLAALSP